jgi:hypothetical protein
VSIRDRAGRRTIAIAFAVAVGLSLRMATAVTSLPHPDEAHYVEDAMWAYGKFDQVSVWEFLREHPKTHYRLAFEDGSVSVWPPPLGGRGRFGRISHPTLQAWLWGVLFAANRPESLESAVRTARIVNVVLDSLAIAMVPVLAASLGASATAGVMGAWLYSLHPPSIAYAGIANQDVLLAPLLLLAAIGTLRATRPLGWAGVGVATGMLVAAKQSGLIALVLIPLWALLRRPRSRIAIMLAVWLVATIVTVSLFVNPMAYADSILNPTFRMGSVGSAPWSRVWSNLGYLFGVEHYWGLGFELHGGPPEWLMARPHVVLTPVYLLLAALAFGSALARIAGKELTVVWVTVVLTFASIPPTDGMWRIHLLWPLVCTGIGCSVSGMTRRRRIALAGLAVVVVGSAFLPGRLAAGGAVRMGDLAFANPEVSIPYGVHRSGLVLSIPRDSKLSRTVVLRPGSYSVVIDATETVLFRFDEESWASYSRLPTEIDVEGWVHSMEITTLGSGSAVRSIRFLER